MFVLYSGSSCDFDQQSSLHQTSHRANMPEAKINISDSNNTIKINEFSRKRTKPFGRKTELTVAVADAVESLRRRQHPPLSRNRTPNQLAINRKRHRHWPSLVGPAAGVAIQPFTGLG
jgi:hypothetical protein